MGIKLETIELIVAGSLIAGCNGDTTSTPDTDPVSEQSYVEIGEHRLEIRRLEEERDEAQTELARRQDELAELVSSVSVECMNAVEEFRPGGEHERWSDEYALNLTHTWCGPANPGAVIDFRIVDEQIAIQSHIVAERTSNIGAHVAASMGLEPGEDLPTTTLG